jgi:hypothetical protein
MQRDPEGRLVIVSSYASNETPRAAEERGAHEREYLTNDKGIDSRRIEVKVGKAGDRTSANVFLPSGATF